MRTLTREKQTDTRHAPSVRLYTGRPMMRRPHDWSHWAHNALNGVPAAIDPT